MDFLFSGLVVLFLVAGVIFLTDSEPSLKKFGAILCFALAINIAVVVQTIPLQFKIQELEKKVQVQTTGETQKP